MNQSWVDRLERRFGFIQIPGLASFLVGMNGIVGALTLFKPEFPAQLVLDPMLLRLGQPWRAITYLFVPPSMDPIWLIFWLLMLYVYLERLETAWGDFKLTLFCLIGSLATASAALLLNLQLSDTAFYTSLFLAFAQINPDFEILLFFILPVKVKWIALVTWIFIALSLLFFGPAWRIASAAGLANYLLFFGPDHWLDLKLWWRRYQNRGRY